MNTLAAGKGFWLPAEAQSIARGRRQAVKRPPSERPRPAQMPGQAKGGAPPIKIRAIRSLSVKTQISINLCKLIKHLLVQGVHSYSRVIMASQFGLDGICARRHTVELPAEIQNAVVKLQASNAAAPGGQTEVYILGMSHVSRESVKAVRSLIEAVKPEVNFYLDRILIAGMQRSSFFRHYNLMQGL